MPAKISVCVVIITVLAACLPLRGQIFTWTGNAGNGNWSEPANWSPAGPPAADAWLKFNDSVQGNVVQDIAGSFGVATLELQGSTTRYNVSGGTLNFSTNGFITAFVFTTAGHVIEAPVVTNGTITVGEYNTPSWLDSAITIKNISGPGGLVQNGLGIVTLGNASYSGPTTINSGMLRIGGWIGAGFSPDQLIIGKLTVQQDVTINPSATLAGNGEMTIAAGSRLHIAGGKVSPGYGALAPDISGLTVNGDVYFGDKSTYEADAVYNGSSDGFVDRLTVNGLLDLRGANDRLIFAGQNTSIAPATYVLMDYESRLGEFDLMTLPSYAQLIYTSAEGSGPGQVIVTTPEPTAAACLLAMAALALRRRVRSLHAG